MSELENACLGLCELDWEAGVCLGCGRSCEEVVGEAPSSDDDALSDDEEES